MLKRVKGEVSFDASGFSSPSATHACISRLEEGMLHPELVWSEERFSPSLFTPSTTIKNKAKEREEVSFARRAIRSQTYCRSLLRWASCEAKGVSTSSQVGGERQKDEEASGRSEGF